MKRALFFLVFFLRECGAAMLSVFSKDERKALEQVVGRTGTLDLSYRGLEEVPEWVFRLTGLRRLLVHHNRLTHFRGPAHKEASRLVLLEEVDASFNEIGDLGDGKWVNDLKLVDVFRLDLSFNNLTSIPANFFFLMQFKEYVFYSRKEKLHPLRHA